MRRDAAISDTLLYGVCNMTRQGAYLFTMGIHAVLPCIGVSGRRVRWDVLCAFRGGDGGAERQSMLLPSAGCMQAAEHDRCSRSPGLPCGFDSLTAAFVVVAYVPTCRLSSGSRKDKVIFSISSF